MVLKWVVCQGCGGGGGSDRETTKVRLFFRQLGLVLLSAVFSCSQPYSVALVELLWLRTCGSHKMS